MNDERRQSLPSERIDLKILQSLRRIIRAVDQHSKRLASEVSLTSPQLVCLLAIEELAPVGQKTLSEKVYLSPSTLVGILDRLQAKGLITRERSKIDRRAQVICLTPQGHDIIARAPSPLQDKLVNALYNLTELEQSTICLSLERIVELMEVQDIDASPLLDTGKLDE
ncbi:MAG: MarR family winged helix-turn-helix transcriptional regulator [Deltaproteobacteria bacterium]|nr:MarR family winged helix-turn-helix transcriptional regulator [Deltaproteobacteria bacterium]